MDSHKFYENEKNARINLFGLEIFIFIFIFLLKPDL